VFLAFGGAEDMLLGPATRFQERMQYLAKTEQRAMLNEPRIL
jgi:hypothetical protein